MITIQCKTFTKKLVPTNYKICVFDKDYEFIVKEFQGTYYCGNCHDTDLIELLGKVGKGSREVFPGSLFQLKTTNNIIACCVPYSGEKTRYLGNIINV